MVKGRELIEFKRRVPLQRVGSNKQVRVSFYR